MQLAIQGINILIWGGVFPLSFDNVNASANTSCLKRSSEMGLDQRKATEVVFFSPVNGVSELRRHVQRLQQTVQVTRHRLIHQSNVTCHKMTQKLQSQDLYRNRVGALTPIESPKRYPLLKIKLYLGSWSGRKSTQEIITSLPT